MIPFQFTHPTLDIDQDLFLKAQNHLTYLKSTLTLFSHIAHPITHHSFNGPETVRDDVAVICHRFRQFKDVIVLGTGGSSLGGKTLCDLKDEPDVRLHFHDNIDPNTFERLFHDIDPKTAGVIVISKSGETAETLMQTFQCLDYWQFCDRDISQHFVVITEPTVNPLRQLAERFNMPCLEHPQDIGGRFAVFTIVGLLPALICGLDVPTLLDGARLVMNHEDSLKNAAMGAVIQYQLLQQGATQSVIFPYVDRLRSFAFWYRQLWAESLGKSGKGTTPIASFGTVDQHSQLQLYLDGPKDKFFTVITHDHDSFPLYANQDKHYDVDGLERYANKTMGDLMMAEQQATLDTLRNNHCPVRQIHIPELTEFALGGLLVHYMFETLAMAVLLEVNPFEQPAVEESKILTRQYLENGPK